MKKVISLVLVALVALMVFAACGNTNSDEPAAKLSFGLGVVASYKSTTDADGDSNGKGGTDVTAVAVVLDADKKIVDIAIDSVDAAAEWTSEGKAVANTEVVSKYDLGTNYNMAAYGKKHDGSEGAVLEWFEQIDAFVATAKGKTLDEVKAFMTEDTYTTGDLAAAGCTISVGDIIKALDKAVASAAESEATAADKLNIALVASVSNTDATEEKEGSVGIDVTINAAAVNAEGKVAASKTDCASTSVTFDLAGKATVDTAAEIKTKGELGDAYNMAAYGKKRDGSDAPVLEWYAQAAAFDAALVGKTASEFAALADADGYGTGDLATAGCTIGISDMIKAATAAATV